MSYTVQVPVVAEASITPNPVSTNGSFLLSATVIGQTITLEPYYYYSGDLYSGEAKEWQSVQ